MTEFFLWHNVSIFKASEM